MASKKSFFNGQGAGSSQGEKQHLIVNTIDEEESNTFSIKTTPSDVVTEINLKPRYEIFFVVMPLFCGYACLFALQRQIKQKYGIADNSSPLSHMYGVAASLVYVGNFVFRLGHNVLFFYLEPRARVIISMTSMALSMSIITSIFFFMKDPSLAWVFIAYACGGIGIGTFESNLLSTITPLGKATKFWAILAMPTGILSITVGGFILLQFGVDAGYIYLGVLVFMIVGLVVFITRFYKLPSSEDNAISIKEFFIQISEIRNWFPQIGFHCLALMVDMFCVSMFSPGVMLYIYNQKYVNFPYFHHSKLASDWLFVIYDACFFLGDTLSRKLFYPVRTIFPLVFWVFAAMGIGCALSNIAILVPLCGFLVAFCNGSIYSQANRKIDTTVDKKYNLIAFSFWLFIGDIGSVLGSNTISYVSVDIKRLYPGGQ